MGYLSLARRNITRNKKLTLGALAGISIAVFLLVTLRTIVTDHASTFDRTDPSRLVVSNRISAVFQLPEQYGERIRRIPGVEAVSAMNWYRGAAPGKGTFFNAACDPETLLQVYPECQIPQEQAQAFIKDQRGAIAGRALVERFGWQLGQPVKLNSTLHYSTLDLVLRGVYSNPNESEELNLFFHERYLEEVMGQPVEVSYFWVRAAPQASLEQIASAIDAQFRGTSAETRTEPEGAFRGRLVPWANIKKWLLWMSIPIIATIFLCSMAAMTVAARRRQRELAVLKVLGLEGKSILILLLGESLMIALAGALIGSLGAWAFHRAVPVSPMLAFHVTPETILFSIGLALLAGLAGVLLPFYRISRTTMIEGLRQG
ncbi:MAG TPA: ABC transporter permease [Pyrinomonadaceae bacterium]|jgi:putative ABC transport system permease protein